MTDLLRLILGVFLRAQGQRSIIFHIGSLGHWGFIRIDYAVQAEPLGEVMLKGIAQPVEMFKVTALKS